jgi:hypothetical protein
MKSSAQIISDAQTRAWLSALSIMLKTVGDAQALSRLSCLSIRVLAMRAWQCGLGNPTKPAYDTELAVINYDTIKK